MRDKQAREWRKHRTQMDRMNTKPNPFKTEADARAVNNLPPIMWKQNVKAAK